MTNHNNEPGCVGIIIILLCVLGICGIKDCLSRTSSEMIKKAKKSQIPMDYVSYLKKYPKGEYAEEALDSILSIIVNDDSPLFKLKATSYIVNTEPIRGSRIEKPIKSYFMPAFFRAWSIPARFMDPFAACFSSYPYPVTDPPP